VTKSAVLYKNSKIKMNFYCSGNNTMKFINTGYTIQLNTDAITDHITI